LIIGLYAAVVQNHVFLLGEMRQGDADNFRIQFDIIDLCMWIFQGLFEAAPYAAADEEYVSGLRVLNHGKMHRFFGAEEVGVGIDRMVIVVQ